MNYLLLAAGGAIGTVLRFGLADITYGFFRSAIFPWGTLLVNLTGSLFIGVLAAINEQQALNSSLRIFLFTGILGGFTTFSAFSLETLQLIRQSHMTYAVLYVLASTLLGLILAAGGFFLTRYSIQLLR